MQHLDRDVSSALKFLRIDSIPSLILTQRIIQILANSTKPIGKNPLIQILESIDNTFVIYPSLYSIQRPSTKHLIGYRSKSSIVPPQAGHYRYDRISRFHDGRSGHRTRDSSAVVNTNTAEAQPFWILLEYS